ncbi:hypothetical protein MYX84_00665 [Acidobacteria bacterium AH-259-O06]|nr:hypothetical protein [Acidobacteria bacterium AH-259-O06]
MHGRLPTFRTLRWTAPLFALLSIFASCERGPTPLTAHVPLHLEDHLDAATIEGSEVPAELPEAAEWGFDEPHPDWKPVVPLDPARKPVQATRTQDALRLVLSEANSGVFPWGPGLLGGIYVDLPDWKREEWAHVLVRARTSGEVDSVGIAFNLRKEPGSELYYSFDFGGEYVDVINDGSVQSYLMRADWSVGREWKGPWRQLGIEVFAEEPANIDILSVSVIPKEAN